MNKLMHPATQSLPETPRSLPGAGVAGGSHYQPAFITNHAQLAQGIEQRISNPQVRGSSPRLGPNHPPPWRTPAAALLPGAAAPPPQSGAALTAPESW